MTLDLDRLEAEAVWDRLDRRALVAIARAAVTWVSHRIDDDMDDGELEHDTRDALRAAGLLAEDCGRGEEG